MQSRLALAEQESQRLDRDEEELRRLENTVEPRFGPIIILNKFLMQSFGHVTANAGQS
jgi:hypothetical protein